MQPLPFWGFPSSGREFQTCCRVTWGAPSGSCRSPSGQAVCGCLPFSMGSLTGDINWGEPQSRAGTQLHSQSPSSPHPQPLHVAGLRPGWALGYTRAVLSTRSPSLAYGVPSPLLAALVCPRCLGVCWSSPPAHTSPPAGREGVQVRGVRAGVHPAGQHEAAHADPHQRPALPVPHLLQDLRAEADAQDPHDRALSGEAVQVQGTGGAGGWWGWGCESTGEHTFLLCCAPRNLARLSPWAWKQLCDASPAHLGMQYLLPAVTGALLLLSDNQCLSLASTGCSGAPSSTNTASPSPPTAREEGGSPIAVGRSQEGLQEGSSPVTLAGSPRAPRGPGLPCRALASPG